MSIIYRCDNCNKEYTLEQYYKLEIVYVHDDRSQRLVAVTRKCSVCGSEFKL